MSRADLFLVCKNPDCGAEVSPYVTECPYCGTRLQKRAPKLEKGLQPARAPRRVPVPSLGVLNTVYTMAIRRTSATGIVDVTINSLTPGNGGQATQVAGQQASSFTVDTLAATDNSASFYNGVIADFTVYPVSLSDAALVEGMTEQRSKYGGF